MTTRIVLVPGFWLGQWAWDEVAPELQQRGFDVVALTLPGLEPDRDPALPVTLADQAAAIEAALEVLDDAWSDLQDQGSFVGLSATQLERFQERAVAQPGGLVSEPVSLINDARHHVPLSVICTAYPASAYQDYAAQGVPFLAALLDYDDVTYADLPTGHWPMWSKPAELAELIARAAG